VKTRALCSALRNTIAQSVTGLQANDHLLDQGKLLVGKREYDAKYGIRNGISGGSSTSVVLDDNQLNQLAASMETNVHRLQALLDDKQLVPPDASSDDGRLLGSTRQYLLTVLVEQKKALDIIEEEVNTNMASDLANRCDPTTCAGLKAAPTPGRVDFRVSLVSQVNVEQHEENALSGIILADVDQCK
jgi:hypothetical protein